MKTMLTLLVFLTLATTSALALEACNRYDDNVDECYENYYRDASNYNYDRHRDCRVIDGYQQCGGDVKVLRKHERFIQPANVRCRYNDYTGRVVCDDPRIRISWE